MRSKSPGFSLVEILTVLAVITILGAIAIVGYQEYTARARASQLLLQYDELRTRTLSNLSQATVESCDRLATALNKSVPVSHDHVGLGYGFEAVTGGYRPVLTVCGKADPAFPLAIKVARAAHDTMAKVSNMVAPNAVLTDSVVSFGLRLSEGERAVCKTAVTQPVDQCAPTAAVVATPKPAPVQVAAAAATPAMLPPQAFEGCPEGMVKGSNGQCRALVCSEEVIAPPTQERIRQAIAISANGIVYELSQAVKIPDFPNLPPMSARNSKGARGSSCLVCGSLDDPHYADVPCSDLDIVLGMTSTCPDEQPVCMNTVRNNNGIPGEYRQCASIPKAITAAADTSGCVPGAFNVINTPGARCSATCYGDNCNFFDPGASLVGTKRTVCR